MIARLLTAILRAYDGLASRWRNAIYKSLGVKMTGYVWIRAIEIPRNWPDILLEAGVCLDRGVTLLCTGPIQESKLIIRSGTYVNRDTMFDAHHHLEIGRNCMIGPGCYLTDANHGMKSGVAVKDQPMQTLPVVIEDEVWLGAHVTVLAGVRIGKGAVIGAGSVVTKNIEAGAIAVGIPAKTIKSRDFSQSSGPTIPQSQ